MIKYAVSVVSQRLAVIGAIRSSLNYDCNRKQEGKKKIQLQQQTNKLTNIGHVAYSNHFAPPHENAKTMDLR